MKRLVLIFLILSGTLVSNKSFSQGKFGVFVGAGTMWYAGDLQETFFAQPQTLRWTANAGLHWQITRRWGLQLNYTVGEILGDDAFASPRRQARGFAFQTLVHEIGLRGTFDILPNDKWKVLPYLTAGVGALNFDPGVVETELRPQSLEQVENPNWTLAIPSGIGAKWQINCEWALKGEVLYHWTISDYLDGVSVRGNPKWDDGLWDVNVGVIYFFSGCGKGKKGGMIEDCDALYDGVDMDKLMEKYGK